MTQPGLNNKYLKYGDIIFIHSNEDPKTYLCARSILEKSVYYLQIPDCDLLNITSYNNQAELMFSIYPKLYYEASKNYLKFKGSDIRKKQMLKKRMEAEKEINLKRIERFLSDYVTIGSEIQLFHIFSKSYVKATREKNSRSNQLFNLSLTKQWSSGMHFKIKINPYYSFKKNGENISYEDQFYFENIKLESRLVYKDVPLINSVFKTQESSPVTKLTSLNQEKSTFNTTLKRQANFQEDLKLDYPFVMENQTFFKQFEAGHRKDDINNFKALFLSSPEAKDLNPKGLKDIHWGDYVRVKHIRRLDKKLGVIYSEHIVTGQCPQSFYYIQEPNPHNLLEKDSASSIFQLLTLNQDLLGQPIEIDVDKFSFPILLRHYLTGRYFKVGKNDSLCCLSEDLERIIKKNPKISCLLSRKAVFKHNKATAFTIKDLNSPGKERTSPHSPVLKIRTTNNHYNIKHSNLNETKEINNLTEEKNDTKQDKLINNDFKEDSALEDILQQELFEFFNETQLLLTVASKDVGNLNSSHSFSLMGQNSEKFLNVAEEEFVNEGRYTLMSEENPLSEGKNFLSSECFQRTFFNMNPLDRKNFSLKSSKEADFFFFSPVPPEEISDIMTLNSKIYPLISLSSKSSLSNRSELFNLAENSLERICFWVCDSKEKRVELIKTNPIPERQKLLREVGFIDIIVKILFELFDRQLLHVNFKSLNSLASGLIAILNLANRENYQNSIYIFQWYSLFKMIIIDEITNNELKIDDLLIQLFHETKLNVSYRGDLERLTPFIQFTNYNRNALNLVIAFCTFNEFLQKDDIEEIIQTVLESDENRKQIFKPFSLRHHELDETKRIVLKINKTDIIEINEINFNTKQKIFQYVSKLIVLAIELSKGNPALTVAYIEELYPFEVCLEILIAKKINPGFKSLFVNLFLESYLAFDCRYSSKQTFPNNIKLKNHVFSHNQADAKIKQNNLNIMIKYFNENIVENQPLQDKINTLNLKHILKDFLNTPEFLIKIQNIFSLEDHHLIKSLLTLCEFILLRGFYSSIHEAEDLRYSLQIFLRNSYSLVNLVLEKKLNPVIARKHRDTRLLEIEEEISVKKSYKLNEDLAALSFWMPTLLNCLIFLEKKNQDSFLNSFFSEPKHMKFFEGPSHKLEKQSKILGFMYTLQYPDSIDIYYYIELLLLNNNEVSQNVIELLYLIFSMRKNFLININNTILLDDIFTSFYQALINISCKLHYFITEANYSKSNDHQRNNELLCDFDSGLKNLLLLIFARTQYDEGSKLEENNELLYKVSEEYYLDVSNCFQNQNILRETGVYLEVLEIIKFVNKSTSYKDKTLDLKNEILKKSVVFLIYFNLKNEENQTEVRDYPKFEDLLIEILLRDNKNLQKLIFRLISEIYRDNYPLLLNLDKMNNDLSGKLGKKFSINYETKKNKEYCVYFLLVLTSFFRIKSKFLTQNQTYLIKEINKNIPNFIKNIEKSLVLASEASATLHETTKTIDVPEDVLLATVFFHVFCNLAEKASSYVLDYCKQFLSIRQIGDLLSKLDDFFMLKLEILKFLNKIYISNKKLEDNESIELQIFIKENLLSELEYYINAKEKFKSFSEEVIFHSALANIFEGKTFLGYSNEKYLIHIDYSSCYEEYLFSGILETFFNYLEKIPKKPNEVDIQILELYTEKLLELERKWSLDLRKKKKISELYPENKKLIDEIMDNTQKKPLKIHSNNPEIYPNSPNLDSNRPLGKIVNFSIAHESQTRKNLLTEHRKEGLLNEEWLETSPKFKQIIDLSNIDLLGGDKSLKKTPQVLKEELKFYVTELIGLKERKTSLYSMILEEELEKTQINQENLFEEMAVEDEHSLELDYIVGFLIEIKTHETKDPSKFKRIVESLINVVGNTSSLIKTKLKAIKIIRKLSNFKKDMKVNEEIQKELVNIELMNFLCKVTAEEDNPLIKYEYILGLVDFMDEVNENIQKSFFDYLTKDQENKFIIKMRNFILESFLDFRDYEKSLMDQNSDFSSISVQFNKIISQKIQACIAGLELLRLSCENHYSEMQNFLRNQTSYNGKIHAKSVNMITFVADLLDKYSKMITERNIELGEKLLEYLIETLQGPCNENQLILCSATKILENLEDIMLDLQLKKTNDKLSGFTNKMIILMLALFEGNKDSFVLNKIVTYVSPELMYDRINQIYHSFYILSKKLAYKEISNHNIKTRKIQKLFGLVKKFTSNFFDFNFDESNEDFYSKEHKNLFSKDKIENSMAEGFNIYILMKLLCSVYPKLKEKINSWKKLKLNLEINSDKGSILLKKSIKFYRNNVVMIEIINKQKDIQRVFFRLPIYTRFLSAYSSKSFSNTVNRESIDEKINGLLNNSEKFHDEMQHFMYLRAKGFRLRISFLSFVRDIGLIVSTIISFLILFKSEDSDLEQQKLTLSFFRVLQLIIEILVYILWMIFTLPLDLKSAKRAYLKTLEMNVKKKEEASYSQTRFSIKIFNPMIYYLLILKHMLFSSYFVYFSLNIAWATLGVFISPIFNSLLLLDIVDRSVILQNVVKSTTINWPQLAMTGILGVIVMFIYSMVGYYGSNDFRENMIYTNLIGWDNDKTLYLCDTPLHCFMFVVNIGLRSGGGVGESVKQPIPTEDSQLYNQRFYYDLTFFLVMNVILLNIIFGIIIDTFAELRVQKNVRDFDEKNNCFICGTDRSTFEKVGISFNKHVKKEHNLWNYLFYVIHLNLKDPREYNGTESYVAAKLKLNDISWFPIGRAFSLALKGEGYYTSIPVEEENKKGKINEKK